MCGGPSSQEKQIEANQASMQTQYMSEASQYFSEEIGVINNIKTSVQPILAAGPNQQGFSPAELSALNSNAITTTAGNYRNAAVVAGENAGAAQGNTYAPTGGQKEVQAAIASAGAQQTSSELNQIEQADYATGRQNYWSAEAALGNTAGILSSGATSLPGSAIQAGDSAFKMADTINKEQQQAIASDIGMGMGLASMALGGFGNMDFSGGSTGGENAMNFFQGAGF